MNKVKYKSVPITADEITPEHVFMNRRQFLKTAGLVGAGALLAACAPQAAPDTAEPSINQDSGPGMVNASSDELGNALNTFQEITNYNNYYEFTTDKEMVAALSKDFTTSPWEVEVYGLVRQPLKFSLENLLSKFTQEERVYRLRCVEGWSLVIPWSGFRLSELLQMVEPSAEARFVRFETVNRPSEMPGMKSPFYPWPYQEGLRLDEAMHDLTLLATGMYGKALLPQNGAPVRLVVPWKYGFKSIKSITKIELVAEMPATLWSSVAPNEYGFYSNVNPEVSHPRWSQATERRIGEIGRRDTLMFNGYAEEVAGLYEGMDLRVNY